MFCFFITWCRGPQDDAKMAISWWRNQMETFSALLAICAGNSPVTGEFPAQRSVTQSFGLRLNKRLVKQWWGWWFETPSRQLWRHSDDVCVHELGSHYSFIWCEGLHYIWVSIYTAVWCSLCLIFGYRVSNMNSRKLNPYNLLQWRHNELDGVSNHQPHDCLLNSLFRRRSKTTSKLRVTGLCTGISPLTGAFPAQRAS